MTGGAFHYRQAEELAQAFGQHGVRFLFLGKSGAILLGFPGTTQDVDVFLPNDAENAGKAIAALRQLGFEFDSILEAEILARKDFVQLKTGPFDVDLLFAPDGIADFESAFARRIERGPHQIANLRDIIASKREAGREKDRVDLPLLEDFLIAFERHQSRPLRSAHEIDRHMKADS